MYVVDNDICLNQDYLLTIFIAKTNTVKYAEFKT